MEEYVTSARMSNSGDGRPTTFREDRRRFASEQVSAWFRPSLKDLILDGVQLTVTALVALFSFGFARFTGHAEAYLAATCATLGTFLFRRLMGAALFAYTYSIAPEAMYVEARSKEDRCFGLIAYPIIAA